MFGQLVVDIIVDGFSKHFQTHTNTHKMKQREQVQMKGNFQYWWAEPWKKKEAEPKPKERKSQTIIRQKAKDLLVIIKNRFFSCWIGWFYKLFCALIANIFKQTAKATGLGC